MGSPKRGAVRGYELLVLTGSDSNDESDPAIAVLVVDVPGEVLGTDPERAVWWMAFVGDRLGQGEADLSDTFQDMMSVR